MTPRQLDRAVNAALSRILPPMVRTLRDDLVAELRQQLATREPAVEAPAAVAPVPAAKPAEAPRQAVAEAGAWTVGEGSNRRLTEAGLARIAELLAERRSDAEISKELGITRRAVQLRRTNGTEGGSPWAAIPQVERDQARAQKNRKYQREWYRKRRAAQQGAQEAKAEAPPAPEASTVVVVPTAEAPKPPQPVVTPAVEAQQVLQAKIAEKRAERAAPPAPVQKPKAEPQVITTTTKEVRAWLVASFKAGGLSQLQAQDRVGFMTHEQALTEANQRRLRAGYPPFAFLGARSAA